ncbi:DUF5710 domain-containing protein [Ruminiclostridium sufflavum]|uniref:DUF5710 domain-containing protein n=1 Tax=Ruminiclostridium sufflavum TaxID=396504 RepID=UPI0030EBC692
MIPLLLNIPYSEKDEAKALGAFWDNERKKWYAKNKYDYPKFKKWILKDIDFATIICDHIYIVVGKKECFKCHRQTTVIGLGLEKYYEISEEPIFGNDKTHWYYYKDIHIASELSPLPENLLAYLKNQYNYYKSYSKTMESECYANHCEHCNIIQIVLL